MAGSGVGPSRLTLRLADPVDIYASDRALLTPPHLHMTVQAQVSEGVTGPVVEEMGRARLRRPELARAVLTLGVQIKAERERAEKERERAGKERERADKERAEKLLAVEKMKAKQTDLLRVQGLLSLRSAIGE